jgi:hypothetical protein
MNLDLDLSRFTNTKLKKIVNVYQLDYINGKSPGLGDFIRGSFCFMQLAKLLNLEFDIDISNHPIAKFIHVQPINGLDYTKIEFYTEYNRSENGKNNYENVINNINLDFIYKSINWLNSKDCEVFGFFSNAFPIIVKHTQQEKNIINLKLLPKPFMINYVNKTLHELKLTKKGYGVIHIRTGDKYLINKESISKEFINKIRNIIKKQIVPYKKYLIISYNNKLKFNLKSIPGFNAIITKIEHVGGEGINKENSEGIMNTMLDYYLMCNSNAILIISVYGHVSGFSKYSAVLNNIPYKYIQIEDKI